MADLGDQVDPELTEMLESSRERLLTLMDDAIALIGLRSEEDLESVKSEKLRVLIESLIVGTPVQAEIETTFEAGDIESRISQELFPLALGKLLTVADGFAVQGRIKIALGSDDRCVLLTVEVPGARLPDHLKKRFFEDFAVDETDVPRGNVGLSPSVAYEATRGMGGDLRVHDGEEGLRFEMSRPVGFREIVFFL